jgi:hypothetical protein
MRNTNEIAIYETEDGQVKVGVLFEEDNLWLTQKLLAELFECSVDNISLHLKNIFKEKELDRQMQLFGISEQLHLTVKKYKTKHYALEAIIAVGYRVNTTRGAQFRTC